MTNAPVVANFLYKAMKRTLKTLNKALCDKCPSCDGTVSAAKVQLIRAMNLAVKKANSKVMKS